MFSLIQNRVYTEKPFFLPTYEMFDRFYNEYFKLHPSLKKLNYLEVGLCGTFLRRLTWDIDVRLMGNPKESDYDVMADFFRDVANTGLNKYRIKVDIHCLSTPDSIKTFNSSFSSDSKYLYISKYVDHIKQYINYNQSYYRTTDYTKQGRCYKVSNNLWVVEDCIDLKDYIVKKNYREGVPNMVEINKYRDLI
tara:strand:+ start:297 stop:875 length:579 start_codon:yes stop_codon:yes gene_type:complete